MDEVTLIDLGDLSPHTREFDHEASLKLSCIDVANHITVCPICSKFYKCDRSVHMLLIVILSVIAILLLKKVLGV